MRISMPLAISFVLGCVSNVLGQGGDVKPLPLPKTIRVQSAAPRGEVWAKLSPKENLLAYHLIQAANAGRDLLFQRTHRYSLAIKSLLEETLSQEQIQKTKSQLGERAFQEFLVYGAKFLDQGGPYTPSNRKYVLQQVTQSQIQALIEGSSKSVQPVQGGSSRDRPLAMRPTVRSAASARESRWKGAGEDRRQLLRARYHRPGSHGGSRSRPSSRTSTRASSARTRGWRARP